VRVVGLLGLQGAFLDHIPHLQRIGAAHHMVRSIGELDAVDRLIIPGGESTVMTKFLRAFDMVSGLQQRITDGMPVWGICAGAIVLAARVDGQPGPLQALPIGVTRNAYGRQIDSVQIDIDVPVMHLTGYPAIFIRSPRIGHWDPAVKIHALRDGDPVFVQHGRVMATTFHPELNADDAFHRYFLEM
jgi:5'-phosphate synthase pdxT subunit